MSYYYLTSYCTKGKETRERQYWAARDVMTVAV